MAQDEKMFTCVKSGLNIRINPNNAAGWRALGMWMVAFVAMLAVFLLSVSRVHSGGATGGLVAVFLFVTAIWAISMIRWMMARSEMVDVKELLALKRELERSKRS